MPDPLAPIIVLEGIDGSGKGTQSKLLQQQLQDMGIAAALLSFPQYDDTFFGARIGDFLNGRFGSLAELNPFLVSLLYAGDRFESKSRIETARRESDVLIFDRYVPSNIAHQAAKLDGAERAELTSWIEQIEYEVFGLPRPDRMILLDTPIDISQRLIADKEARSYTDQAADLQEADTSYLSRVRLAYCELANASSDWSMIPVADADRIRSIGEISTDVLECVMQVLDQTDGTRS